MKVKKKPKSEVYFLGGYWRVSVERKLVSTHSTKKEAEKAMRNGRCKSCHRVFVGDDDIRRLDKSRFAYQSVDAEALSICPDCEDSQLFPEAARK